MTERAPIPDAALDDRLGLVGTAGSGKTYNSGGAIERLLNKGARCIIVDPLDVWWGLRVLADGKTPSPYNIAILGGAHGDLPLNEHAGALIGETVASSAESFIVSLGTLGTKASERRFMLTFLTSLYKHVSGEPLHLVFDEADLWAPQRLLDKEGEAAKLLGQMETIVRRGRVKGFIPWLITQRPAVLSKDVLSQVDGLVAFKLTSSQDRDAIGDWVQGQADKEQWKSIWAALPTLERGRGVVWVPGRGILETVAFPTKKTFDSSATPKRGETKRSATLKPLNVEALKGRLETVAKEAVENDPRRLKAQVAELQRALKVAQQQSAPSGTSDAELGPLLDQAHAEGYARGTAETRAKLWPEMGQRLQALAGEARSLFDEIGNAARNAQSKLLDSAAEKAKPPVGYVAVAPAAQRRPVASQLAAKPARAPIAAARPKARATSGGNGGLPGVQQRIVDALAELRALGVERAPRVLVAFLAGYSHLNSKGFVNAIGAASSAGLLRYPQPGEVELLDPGLDAACTATEPLSSEELQGRIVALLGGKEGRILEAVIERYPDETPREEIAAAAGYGHLNSKGFVNAIGRLRSLGFVDYPRPGAVVATPLLFVKGA